MKYQKAKKFKRNGKAKAQRRQERYRCASVIGYLDYEYTRRRTIQILELLIDLRRNHAHFRFYPFFDLTHQLGRVHVFWRDRLAD